MSVIEASKEDRSEGAREKRHWWEAVVHCVTQIQLRTTVTQRIYSKKKSVFKKQT